MKNNYFQISGIKNVITEIQNLTDFFRLKGTQRKDYFLFILKNAQ